MSEASRARRQFLINRLEEIAAAQGPPEADLPDWLDHADLDPSWGPLGSLARRLLEPEAYARLLDIDAEAHGRPLSPRGGIQASEEIAAASRFLNGAEAWQRPPGTPINRP